MPEEPRQRIERVAGSRRARLTPVPGTDPLPEPASAASAREETPSASGTQRGPNDERLRRDVPPHY